MRGIPLLSKLDEQHFSLKDKTTEYVEDVDHMLAEISEHIDSITR